ncbi:MAG: hypothetical protein B6241_11255 [Spirochaetaceae bacterium 4572_59]|nr:MAG: hypothetical protein B6241_11255 [Spirochaetaceae bacterium 4572_59]
MKKLLSIGLVLLLSMLFFACDDSSDSPTSNEDYAGTWYEGTDKLILTDSTFESFEENTAVYQAVTKGTITKKSTTTFDKTVTSVYLHDYYDDSITAADEGWYTKAELIAWGINKGAWTDEATMNDVWQGDPFATKTMTFSLSADGLTLTLDGDSWSTTAPELH